MKKFLTTILCIVYVVASGGVTVNFHYCMGKFKGWDINTEPAKTCNNCGMAKENNKGCCNDKQETFQLKKDQLASTINDIPDNHFVYTDQRDSLLVRSLINFLDYNVQPLHSPPLIKPVSPVLLNCVFRV